MIAADPAAGSSRGRALIAILLVAVAVARIAATYSVFTNTFDEPAHVTGGLAWWTSGNAAVEPLHPPLPRAAVALGPYLTGVRVERDEDPARAETGILYRGGHYWRTLTLARMGTLPFFLLAAFAVWTWGTRIGGGDVALVAVGLVTTLPPILAHAGLATTDMAATGTLALALLAAVRWLDLATPGRGVLLGLAVGIALLSKLSALVFFPAAFLAVWAVRAAGARRFPGVVPRPVVPTPGGVILVLLIAGVTVWGGYRFSCHPLTAPDERPHHAIDALAGESGGLHDLLVEAAETVPVPAPDFWRGVNQLRAKETQGHAAYLLGKRLEGHGDPAFFPVALAVKTPIGFLVLVLAGGYLLLLREFPRTGDSRVLEPVVAAAAMLVIVLPSRINIGVRHLLPVYPFLAVAAGWGAVALWRSGGWKRGTVIVLAGWHLVSGAVAHPDYLPYMNELGAGRPDAILVDSDLDWGQDLHRLAGALRDLRVPEVSLAYFGTADPARAGLPPFRILPPGERRTGWIAASRTLLKLRPGYAWLDSLPPERVVGKSIELFHLPGESPSGASGTNQHPNPSRRRP
jgi:hypothetical protein